jgi:hypothetical protein
VIDDRDLAGSILRADLLCAADHGAAARRRVMVVRVKAIITFRRRAMRLTAVLACLMWSSTAMALNIHRTDWISFSFVGGFEEQQIANANKWINETCKPDELGNITGFSYKPSPDSKLSVTVFCHRGSGKLGTVRVTRVRFESAFAFEMDQLNSSTALVIGFDFEKADAGMEPTGEAVIVVRD